MVADEDPPDAKSLELESSDPSQLTALRNWLRAQPGVEVRFTSRPTGPGELGVVDVLTVLASSSVLTAAIKTLPDFLRSRRSGFRIEVAAGDKKITIDTTNVKEVAGVIERMLDGRG